MVKSKKMLNHSTLLTSNTTILIFFCELSTHIIIIIFLCLDITNTQAYFLFVKVSYKPEVGRCLIATR